MSNTTGYLGRFASSTGTATVTGAGSTWTNSGDLFVGRENESTGTLNIEAGGSVSNDIGYIGEEGGSTGTVTVTGAGSTWTNSAELNVGHHGTGTLNIEAGGEVSSFRGGIGVNANSSGEVIVTGANSAWTNTSGFEFRVGESGTGTLTVADGGSVSTNWANMANMTIGREEDSTGTVTVTGAGSTLTGFFVLNVGLFGSGSLTIADGGSVSNQHGQVFGDATVTGAGSTWTNTGGLSIESGAVGGGTLTIADGGSVSNAGGAIAFSLGTTASATVTGAGSTWTSSGSLTVGGSGTGTLNIENGGLVTVGDTMTLAANSSGTGTVNLDGGTLDMEGSNIAFGDGAAAFNFTAGTLRNVGTFGSSLNQQGGRLEIGASAGTTTISGDYTSTSAATLAIELGGLTAGTQHDQLIVTGDASLDGTLALSLIDNFEPQLGDEFTILTAAGVSGQFAAVTGYQIGPDRSLATVYDSSAVRLVTAIPGDANLDGVVNIADLSVLASNWQRGVSDGLVAYWSHGDFNLDGQVTIADLSILANNWQAGVAADAPTMSFAEALAMFDVFNGVVIPEPSSLGLLGIAGMLALRRRR